MYNTFVPNIENNAFSYDTVNARGRSSIADRRRPSPKRYKSKKKNTATVVEIRSRPRPSAPVPRRLFHRRSVRVRSPNTVIHKKNTVAQYINTGWKIIKKKYYNNAVAPAETSTDRTPGRRRHIVRGRKSETSRQSSGRPRSRRWWTSSQRTNIVRNIRKRRIFHPSHYLW